MNIATGATNAKTVNIATSASLLHVITLGTASTTISVPASTTFGGSVGLSGLTTNSTIYLNSSGAVAALASSTAGNILTATSTAPYFTWQRPVTANTATSSLSADVTMTNANQYYDGPSVSLTAGTWFIVGGVTLRAGLTTTKFTAKLWDGTTVESSAEIIPAYDGSNAYGAITLAGIVAPGSTTTYKISVAASDTSGTIKAAAPDNGAGNNASFIRAVKIAP